MNKNVSIILSVFVLISIISLINCVYADEVTSVNVIGIKGYVWNVTLNVIGVSNPDLLVASVENDTSATTGVANFYYSSAAQTVSYYAVARNNGKIMATARAGNFSTGSGLTTINLFPNVVTAPPATTLIINTSTANSDVSDNSNINASGSGNSTTINLGSSFVSGAWGKVKSGFSAYWKWIVYGIVVLIILAGIVLGIIWWMKRAPQKPYEFIRKSDNLVMPGDNERPIAQGRRIDDELASAEEKIKEAQEEIARIKSKKDRLNNAKLKYEQAKKDLEEVEGEY